MLTKSTFIRTLTLTIDCLIVYTSTLCSQNFEYVEFKIDTAHLSPFSIQKTNDGNLLVVCSQSCFVPNGTAIEGCPISDQFIKIDYNLGTIFRKDLFNGRSFPRQEWNELASGDFFAFMSSSSNFSCGNISVSGFGFSKFERYQIDSEANLLNHQIYNDECTLSPLSYLSTADNQYLVFVRAEDESFERDNRILFIDSSYEIIDTIIYDDLNLSRFQVSHIKNDSLYGIYTSTQTGSLNLIAFDLNSSNYNQRIITPLGPADNFYSIRDFAKDAGNNGYVATSNDEIKVSKFNDGGELVWITTLPADISNPGIKLQSIDQNKLAVLSGYLNPISNTIDSRIQILDEDGTEIFRKEYQLDTTNITPVDFEFIGNSVVIVGGVNNENNFAPSTPRRTFVLLENDYLSSINYTSNQNDLQVYPNPTSGILRISAADFSKYKQLDIYSASGKFIKMDKITSNEIDISELKSGVYIAVMKSTDNILKTFKIIKL